MPPKIVRVRSARQRKNDDGTLKPNFVCEIDDTEIKPGDPYKHVSIKTGPYSSQTRRRCASCPDWQPWDLSSALWAQLARIVHEARETIIDNDDPEEIKGALESAAAEIREIAEEKRESGDNIEQGFGRSTSQSEELAEMAEQLNAWAEEIDGIALPDLPDPEETDCEDCTSQEPGSVEAPASDACTTCGGDGTYTPDEPTEEQLDQWRGEVEEACSALDDSPA